MATNELAARGYAALADAQQMLANLTEPAAVEDSREWITEIQRSAANLHDVLVEHCKEAEDRDGILAAATDEKPALIPESAHLVDEHAEMMRRARDLVHEAETQAAFDDFDIELIRLKAAILRDMVRVHLHRSGSLTYEAYFRVEGGEGG